MTKNSSVSAVHGVVVSRGVLERGLYRRLPEIEVVLYILCVILLEYGIWAYDSFVTLDGPVHLQNARLLLDYLQSRNSQLLGDYFNTNFTLFPYWFGHVSLAALLTVFSPPIAVKIFVATYVALFALLVRLIVRTLNKQAMFLSFLGLLLILNRPTQMGFFSFCFSQVFMLATIWHWLAYPVRPTYPRLLARTLLLLATYFSHPTTYAITAAILGILTIWPCVCQKSIDDSGLRPDMRECWGGFAVLAITVLPSALLLIAYVLGAPSYRIEPRSTFTAILVNFAEQTNLMLVTNAEAPFGIGVAALFIGLFFVVLKQRFRYRNLLQADAFLIASLMTLAVHVYASLYIVGFFERMQNIPLLLLLFWLCSGSWQHIYWQGIPVVVSFVLAALLWLRLPIYAEASANVEEIESILPAIAEGSTVLPLTYAPFGCRKDQSKITDLFYLFLHTPEYLGAYDRHIVMLQNIGPLYPMYPFRWRGDKNPYVHIQRGFGFENPPPSVDFVSYHRRTGGSVDYVVTWCLDVRFDGHPSVQEVRKQLAEGYEQVVMSKNGQFVVYRARVPGSGAVESREREHSPDRLTIRDYLQLSYELYKAKKFEESIKAAQRGLAIDPRSDGAYNNICAAYNELGQWAPAIDACQKALEINPGSSLARNNLSVAIKKGQ